MSKECGCNGRCGDQCRCKKRENPGEKRDAGERAIPDKENKND